MTESTDRSPSDSGSAAALLLRMRELEVATDRADGGAETQPSLWERLLEIQWNCAELTDAVTAVQHHQRIHPGTSPL